MLIPSLVLSALLAAPPAKVRTAAVPAARALQPAPTRWVEAAPAGFRFADGLGAAIAAHEIRDAVIVVPIEGVGEKRLRLRRFNGVALDARVEVGAVKREARAELTAALRGVAHFEGTVDGSDTGSCYLAFGATGAAGWIDLGDEGSFALRRVASDAPGLCAGAVEFVRTSGTSAPDVPACGGVHEEHDHDEGGLAGFGSVPPGVRKVVEIAVDTDYDYYRIFGDETAATEYIGTLVGAIAAIYRRDCDATFVTSYLRLQTDEADLFNESDPLVPFRQFWDANGGDIGRDLFTLITGRRNLPYGGVAYLNAACASFGYSVNGYINGRFVDPVVTNPGNWDINVAAHEWGHNCGTRHTHDYGIDTCASGGVQRGTIMSYCHTVQGASSNVDLRFHRGTGIAIESFIATAPCLASDCNDNGIADADEIAADAGLDSNGDGIIDACQDCNGNGQPDPVEIMLGTEQDADGDMLPDSCERDCDGDGVPDSLEIAQDPSLDVDGNRELDACQEDCDGDGVADVAEILADMELDRTRDGRLDSCEDCDGDGITDFVELQGSMSRWVASASDSLLRELDPRSGVIRRAVPCGTAPINDLAIGPDGRLYAAAGNRVYALDRVNDAAASEWSVALPGEARALAVAPNNGMAVLLANGRIQILDPLGQLGMTFVQPFTVDDARDLVFRTGVPGGVEALVTQSNGIVRRFQWPAAATSVFADLTALAPELRGAFVLDDGSVLVAASALGQILKLDPTGASLGEWDVENNALLFGVYAICDAGDGRAVLATGPGSSSTVNGFNKATGYTERTYRVYPSDAPAATAIVIAPPSATDLDGDLVPDECQGHTNPADLNGDGTVDAADLAVLLNAWGPCAGCPGDLDGDGTVGAADLATLLNAWS